LFHISRVAFSLSQRFSHRPSRILQSSTIVFDSSATSVFSIHFAFISSAFRLKTPLDQHAQRQHPILLHHQNIYPNVWPWRLQLRHPYQPTHQEPNPRHSTTQTLKDHHNIIHYQTQPAHTNNVSTTNTPRPNRKHGTWRLQLSSAAAPATRNAHGPL
jgi:hypothetical protein